MAKLTKSDLPTYYQMIKILIFGSLVLILTGTVLRRIDSVTALQLSNFSVIVRAVVLIVFIVALFLGWYRANDKDYELTQDAIKITTKGLFSSTLIYPLADINKYEMKQGYFGRKYDYGTLAISMDGHTQSAVLKNINNPNKVLNRLASAKSVN